MIRRAFLRFLAGAGLASSSGVTPNQIAALAGSMPPLQPDGSWVPEQTSREDGEFLRARGDLTGSLYQRREMRARSLGEMPAHISAPKSWGGPFRLHVWEQEQRKEQETLDRLQNDEAFARKALKALGLLS